MNNQNNNMIQTNNQMLNNNQINIQGINNVMPSNLMMGSSGSLYMQNFQSTFNNISGNVNLIETNLNNMNNILS